MLNSPTIFLFIVIFIIMAITAIAGVYWTPSPTTPRRDWVKRSIVSSLMFAISFLLLASAVLLAATPTPDFFRLSQFLPAILMVTLGITLLLMIGTYVRVITWRYYERVTEWGLAKLSKMTKKRK
jgi:hypothetical protein